MRDFFKGFKSGFKEFGDGITIIVNSILLTLVYIVGVGITAIVAKVVGKDFLEMETSRKKESYWDDLNLKKEDIDKYYRRF